MAGGDGLSLLLLLLLEKRLKSIQALVHHFCALQASGEAGSGGGARGSALGELIPKVVRE